MGGYKKIWRTFGKSIANIKRSGSKIMEASAHPCDAATFPRRRSCPKDTVKTVERAGQFNKWKEAAWMLWVKGEMRERIALIFIHEGRY